VEPDFLTVFRTMDLTLGQILRARLQGDGIPARLADEHTNQTQQLWAPALGGVRVQVPAKHFEEAKRIIADFESGRLALADDDEPAVSRPPAVRLPRWLIPALLLFFILYGIWTGAPHH
jgi:hypothetical protein